MTDTIARGAANQAGAIVNKNAYDEAQDFLPLKGIDHVEFWVGNAKQSAHYFRALWGFTPIAYAGLETGVRDRISYVMRRNDITLVVTGALSPDGEIAEHVHRHGDGVKDIAFLVDDATASFAETTKRGARPAIEPVELDGGEDGILRRSAVFTYGEVRHSFIDRTDYQGVFAPGYRKVKKPAAAAQGMSLLEIDHCVGNVALGDMNRYVDYYRDVFGFAQLIHYDDKVIHTDYSALMSKVMTNGNGRVKFPINEPAAGKKKSQIQEFLDYYLDAGTQHIALRTEDIVTTVRTLRGLGVEFLGMPHAYYEQLGARVGDVGVPIETLEELGIEADRDEEGYLLQIFTRPIQDRPTFFFEIIERHGSRGFGVGNFKALFEAIEIEQAGAGTCRRAVCGVGIDGAEPPASSCSRPAGCGPPRRGRYCLSSNWKLSTIGSLIADAHKIGRRARSRRRSRARPDRRSQEGTPRLFPARSRGPEPRRVARAGPVQAGLSRRELLAGQVHRSRRRPHRSSQGRRWPDLRAFRPPSRPNCPPHASQTKYGLSCGPMGWIAQGPGPGELGLVRRRVREQAEEVR